MRRYLIGITGGSGYIGSSLAKHLAGSFDVRLLDVRVPEQSFSEAVSFQRCDVRNYEEVKKAFQIGRNALILADSRFNIEKLKTFADITVLENLGYEEERICKDCEIKSDLVILFAKKR